MRVMLCGQLQTIMEFKQAEARALLQGLQKCWSEGFWGMAIEAASMVLVQILKGTMENPWCIVYKVREMQ